MRSRFARFLSIPLGTNRLLHTGSSKCVTPNTSSYDWHTQDRSNHAILTSRIRTLDFRSHNHIACLRGISPILTVACAKAPTTCSQSIPAFVRYNQILFFIYNWIYINNLSLPFGMMDSLKTISKFT